MFKLRPYQTDIINDAREALRSHNSVLIQAPTGSGKTALSADMIGSASQRNNLSYFICHRAELIEQTSETFRMEGIAHGFIASGMRADPYQNVQICSIDTLKSRVDSLPHPKFCVWDEAHHVGAGGWARVHGTYSKAKHVGLTATPERLDGKGLGEWFSHMVKGPSVAWLMDEGYLSKYKAYAPSIPDLTGIHKRMGDFAKGELAEAMDTNCITGDAISHYNNLAPGKSAVAFCVSIKHSQHVTEKFNNAGIVAAHIDGKMAKSTRKEIISGFRQGSIKVLTNVDIVGEGFDLPAMGASILLRPTQSLALYLQQVGRSLRPAEGKDHAVILDHAGNIMRHGLPDEVRDWTLEGRQGKGKGDKKEAEDVNVRQCPKCFYVHVPSPRCPLCGHLYEIKERIPEQVEGELQEVNKELLKKQRRREQGSAQSLEDLVAVGKLRGYKNPHGWASYIYNARKAKMEARG